MQVSAGKNCFAIFKSSPYRIRCPLMATRLTLNAPTSKMNRPRPASATFRRRAKNENKNSLDRSVVLFAAECRCADRGRNREKSARRTRRGGQDQGGSKRTRDGPHFVCAGSGRPLRRRAQTATQDAHGNQHRGK